MAELYSFGEVSNFDRQELLNTVDQVRREQIQHYDLRDSGTEISFEEASFTITTASDMTLEAVADVLRQKATKRNLSPDLRFPARRGRGRQPAAALVKLLKGQDVEVPLQICGFRTALA